MVKIATMGKGTRQFPPGDDREIDTGMPISHPAVLIPIIALLILLIVGLITCFCKLWPKMVPESCRIFGKRSADKNVELQLGRRERSRSPRRPSEASQVSGRSNRTGNQNRRTPSFNSNDWATRPYLDRADQPPKYPSPPAYNAPPSYGLSPMSMSTALPPPPPSYQSFKSQQHGNVSLA